MSGNGSDPKKPKKKQRKVVEVLRDDHVQRALRWMEQAGYVIVEDEDAKSRKK